MAVQSVNVAVYQRFASRPDTFLSITLLAYHIGSRKRALCKRKSYEEAEIVTTRAANDL